jgi:hypothetical protein
VKPVPATVAALTVTAAVPVEDRVNVCVVAVFTLTLPKDKLDELTLSVGAEAPSDRAKVLATLLALAVRVTVWAVVTEETVAVKAAVVEPAATVTEAGTVTDELLLARLTANPPLGAAALSATVQESVPAPVIDPLAQLNEDSFVVGTTPASCRAKVFVTPLALAVNVTVCAVLTEETVARKVALVDHLFTSTEAGTATALLLLARFTVNGPVPSALVSVTVQLTVPAPVIEALLQLSPLSVAAAAGRQANRAVRSKPVQKRWKRLTSARPVAWRRFKREGWVHRDAPCAANLF